MKHNHPSIIFILVTVLAFGCSSSQTYLTVNQQQDNPGSVSKLLVIALTPNNENRETGEKEIVYWLRNEKFDAVASVDVMSVRGRLPVKEEIIETMNEYGFDGVLTMGLVDVGKESKFVSPGTNSNVYFYNYLSAWNGYYTPGYVDQARMITVESNLYVFPKGEIAFSATSESIISDSFESFVADFSKSLVKSLKKSKIIKAQE